MLIAFRTKNFMSFRSETLFWLEPEPAIKYSTQDICRDASALKVATVFGANASGKSSLLRALSMGITVAHFKYDNLRGILVDTYTPLPPYNKKLFIAVNETDYLTRKSSTVAHNP